LAADDKVGVTPPENFHSPPHAGGVAELRIAPCGLITNKAAVSQRLSTPLATDDGQNCESKPRGSSVPLTKRDQFRRITLLCCHFVRNLAYDQAGRTPSLKSASQFWITVHKNFLDHYVLEWCKLFIDTKNGYPGEHRWDNVVTDKARFEAELFRHINKTQFHTLLNAMRKARNKFMLISTIYLLKILHIWV
jgi:hypothetical protein